MDALSLKGVKVELTSLKEGSNLVCGRMVPKILYPCSLKTFNSPSPSPLFAPDQTLLLSQRQKGWGGQTDDESIACSHVVRLSNMLKV